MYRARGNVIRDAGQIAGNERPENDDTNWELVAEGNAAILLEDGGGVTFDSSTNAGEVNAALGVPISYELSGTGADRTATVSPALNSAATEINTGMTNYISGLGFHSGNDSVAMWQAGIDYDIGDTVSFLINTGDIDHHNPNTGIADVPAYPIIFHFQYLGGGTAGSGTDRPVTRSANPGIGTASTQWAVAAGTTTPWLRTTTASDAPGILQYASGAYVTYDDRLWRAVQNILQNASGEVVVHIFLTMRIILLLGRLKYQLLLYSSLMAVEMMKEPWMSSHLQMVLMK